MNIEMIKKSANSISDMDISKYSNSSSIESRTRTEKMGYSLDITGKVMENAAYGKEDLKSRDELALEAGMTDVSVQRNYMAVMSNSMSDEDFAKLVKDGVNPINTGVEEVVTNLDKIKITLAEAGCFVEGFNDNLSNEEVEAATGSFAQTAIVKKALDASDLPVNNDNIAAVNEALNIANNLHPLSDEACGYMINKDLEPTVENVYKAEYSAGIDVRKSATGVRYDGANTYANSGQSKEFWYEIADQAQKIVEEARVSDDKLTIDDAKWLVTHQIPLTEDNLLKLSKLKQVTIPMDKRDLLRSMMSALLDGQSPKTASLVDYRSDYEKAVDIKNAVESIGDEAVYRVVSKEKSLTVESLCNEQVKVNESKGTSIPSYIDEKIVPINSENNEEFIKAKRILEETRLAMTSEANLVLLRKGISVDTTDLQQLVEELKAAEAEFYRPLLTNQEYTNEKGIQNTGNDDDLLASRIALFKSTMQVVRSIPTYPEEMIGEALVTDDNSGVVRIGNRDFSEGDYSLDVVNKSGLGLKNYFDRIERSYETLMTVPRADMGDSIRKAFRNVDDILKDLHMPNDENNRQAVRIMGYSQIQIDRESVEKVVDAANTLKNVIEMLTPERTLRLIREGHNPLNDNMYELSKELSKETVDERNESYSKFLVKLERNKDITAEEKKAYIGMYRLMNQVSKQDYRVVGNLISSGQELTFNNLLRAARTNKNRGLDIKVDDELGFLENLSRSSETITEQLSVGFAKLIDPNASDKPDVADMRQIGENVIRDATQQENDIDTEYNKEMFGLIKEASEYEAKAENILRESKVTVSVENILAAKEIQTGSNKAVKELLESKKTDSRRMLRVRESLREQSKAIVGDFTDRESANKAVGEFTKATREASENAVNILRNSEDVKAFMAANKTISLAGLMARYESYEIPIETEDGFASIHLEIVHNSHDKAKVEVRYNTERFGSVTGTFTPDKDEVSAYFVAESGPFLDELKGKMEEFETSLKKEGLKLKDTNFVSGRETKEIVGEAYENDEISDSKLYSIAKSFIKLLAKE